MRKEISLIVLACSYLICSCSSNNRNTQEVVHQNQTPEVLNERKIEADISSISKRDDSDFVQKLFTEAMSKDSSLKNLNNKITGIGQLKDDNLEPYREYVQNNDLYWSSVNSYINQLNDSTLRIKMKDLFQILESKYNSRIHEHELVVKNLEDKEATLDDCYIVMKLMVTASMMKNYQQNELPDLEPINRVIYLYEDLIHKSQPYMKIK